MSDRSCQRRVCLANDWKWLSVSWIFYWCAWCQLVYRADLCKDEIISGKMGKIQKTARSHDLQDSMRGACIMVIRWQVRRQPRHCGIRRGGVVHTSARLRWYTLVARDRTSGDCSGRILTLGGSSSVLIAVDACTSRISLSLCDSMHAHCQPKLHFRQYSHSN